MVGGREDCWERAKGEKRRDDVIADLWNESFEILIEHL